MSGPWRWDDLAQSTRDSIDLQGVDEDELLMRRCGCDPRPSGWWLCQYHDGWQDAAEDVTTTLEAAEARIDALCDLIRALPVSVETFGRTTKHYVWDETGTPVPAGIAHVNLWREVTGR